MHCRLSHWNSALEQTGQSSSSLLSSHSAKPSQRQARGMQSTSPDRQENCSGEQVGGSVEDRQAVRGRSRGSRRAGPGFEWQLTSAGQLVLQQDQMDGTRAASCPVALHDADVGAAAIVPRARVFTCSDGTLR